MHICKPTGKKKKGKGTKPTISSLYSDKSNCGRVILIMLKRRI